MSFNLAPCKRCGATLGYKDHDGQYHLRCRILSLFDALDVAENWMTFHARHVPPRTACGEGCEKQFNEAISEIRKARKGL